MLGAMVKGSSGAALVDRSAMLASLVSAILQTRIWWEFMQSKSNRSDGASRLLNMDPFADQFGFQLVEVQVPIWPWVEPIAKFLSLVQSALERRWCG